MSIVKFADLIDAQVIGNHLGVTAETVRNWYNQGRIPGHRLGRKTIRFRLGEVRP